ncbi:MAG: phage tail protein [Pseudomonas veronii]|uniref:phage tail protein n=1 Tax=Pseudomonas veronii TaxID=76761 RepID=UPI003C7258E0
MSAIITLAGESQIALKQSQKKPLVIQKFIFANVPGLDPLAPVDRAAGKPAAAQIVYDYLIPQDGAGFVNPNQVVYSAQLGSNIGDWDFNWVGLEDSDGVLFAVSYVPLQQKRKNIEPHQIGNNLTRNFLVAFSGALALTGITIDARTWQHDFTVRLAGIDERQRYSNHNLYGRACFFGKSLALEATGNGYQLAPGIAYIAGIRVFVGAPFPIATVIPVGKVWLDVCLERQANDTVTSWKVVYGNHADYTDSAGARHFCTPIADFVSPSQIVDLRTSQPINEPVVACFATVNALNVVRSDLSAAIGSLLDGTTPAGKAHQLATPRWVSVYGAALGSMLFDGSAHTSLELSLANSPIIPGTYTKIHFNEKGLAVHGSNPSTLLDYGITDAYPKWFIDASRQQIDGVIDVHAEALKNKVGRDFCTYVGFSSNNPLYPYMRQEDSGIAYYLQPALGFTPVRQGGGPGLNDNQIRIGYSGATGRIRAHVDTADFGDIWTTLHAELNTTRLKLPNGFTLLIGTFSLGAAASASQGIVFPIAFTEFFMGGWAQPTSGGASDQVGVSNGHIQGMLLTKGAADIYARTGTWFAIGK